MYYTSVKALIKVYFMATVITGSINNNQSVYKRGGAVADSNITVVAPGLPMHPRNQSSNGADYSNDDVKSRDSDSKLGNRIITKTSRAQHYFSHERQLAPSGYDIHGQYIEGANVTTTTLSNDEAADNNPFTADNGNFFYTRGSTVTTKAIPTKL